MRASKCWPDYKIAGVNIRYFVIGQGAGSLLASTTRALPNHNCVPYVHRWLYNNEMKSKMVLTTASTFHENAFMECWSIR